MMQPSSQCIIIPTWSLRFAHSIILDTFLCVDSRDSALASFHAWRSFDPRPLSTRCRPVPAAVYAL